MGKHHTEDYKLSAVKYALRTDNQVETCEVFDCKRSSLQEWIDLYQKTGSPVRKTRKNRIAYKVRQEHIDFLRAELKKKPDIFMSDLKELLEKKYPDFSLTRVHIGRLILLRFGFIKIFYQEMFTNIFLIPYIPQFFPENFL